MTITPTALAGQEQATGSGGMSTGAKAGIGAGIGLAVVIAAAFGFWYSWYQRRRRRRSLHESDHYPQSTLPAMSEYGSGGRDYGTGSALGAGVGYTDRSADRSDTRSELPSPPMGSPDPLLGNRQADRLHPNGPVSWASSGQNPSDVHSVSDYGEATAAAGGVGYFPAELPENDQVGALAGRTLSNGSQHQNRALSRSSGNAPYPEQSNMPSRNLSQQTTHSRTLSDSSHHANAYHSSMGSDNPYAAELQASMQQSAELEANMSQRMSMERKPFRPGHMLTKNNKGEIGPSQNF